MKGKTVLLIDDDDLLQELLQITIEGEGYKVITAADGEQGVELVKTEIIDLILLDLMMPVMDGVRFIEWLRTEQNSKVPVLVMSAMSKPTLANEVRALGATDLLVKPVEMDTFKARLHALLD